MLIKLLFIWEALAAVVSEVRMYLMGEFHGH